MMHLAPDDVRAMDWEDVLGLAAYAGIEAEETKRAASGGQQPGAKTSRLKKR